MQEQFKTDMAYSEWFAWLVDIASYFVDYFESKVNDLRSNNRQKDYDGEKVPFCITTFITR